MFHIGFRWGCGVTPVGPVHGSLSLKFNGRNFTYSFYKTYLNVILYHDEAITQQNSPSNRLHPISNNPKSNRITSLHKLKYGCISSGGHYTHNGPLFDEEGGRTDRLFEQPKYDSANIMNRIWTYVQKISFWLLTFFCHAF